METPQNPWVTLHPYLQGTVFMGMGIGTAKYIWGLPCHSLLAFEVSEGKDDGYECKKNSVN
jgi:hypothetical protein